MEQITCPHCGAANPKSAIATTCVRCMQPLRDAPHEQDGAAARPSRQQAAEHADVRSPPSEPVLPPKFTPPPAPPLPATPIQSYSHEDARPKPQTTGLSMAAPGDEPKYVPTGLVLISVALVLTPILAVMWLAGTKGTSSPPPPAMRVVSPPPMRPVRAVPPPMPEPARARGKLTIRLPGDVTVDTCSVQLSRTRGGTRESLLRANAPQSVEVGEYQIMGAQITVTDADGTPWRYSLRPQGPSPGPHGELVNSVQVEPDKESTIDLFADPRIAFQVVPERVRPGQTVQLSMTPAVGHGMRISDCRQGVAGHAARGDLVVHRPDGSTLKRGQGGFG